MANAAARFKTGAWAALTLLLPWLAQAEPIRLLTENDAPFNLPDEHGGVTGISSEMVMEMFRRAGIDYRIDMLPWARAYNLAQTDPRACLFSTTRMPEREKLFVWIGPLLKNDWAVFAGPRSPSGPQTMDSLRPYAIGGYRGDAVAQYLLDRGYKLDIVSDDVLNLRKLMAGHIDFWASGVYHAHYLAEHERLGPLRQVAVFSTSYLYLACHPQTPFRRVARLNAALDAMQKDGFMDSVKKRYLAAP
ncbi:ABC transporter substrate-binding protein [Chromobacterium sp. IIBBL 290-4]|uniref:substrate-binding periplasmic protein n=1 Tax=Chromobacterium sp. IIBBL 290-4 TaxID=2953890 RepID=UPI0020B74A41|nr:transporter substrate-binding domain-containing protein [Chromobacterium sp. IIBBL 290-4]UTH76406.1 transporter substrate-binding domain-containing protein [Chromobacterium sp. IIBBL 290-4]